MTALGVAALGGADQVKSASVCGAGADQMERAPQVPPCQIPMSGQYRPLAGPLVTREHTLVAQELDDASWADEGNPVWRTILDAVDRGNESERSEPVVFVGDRAVEEATVLLRGTAAAL